MLNKPASLLAGLFLLIFANNKRLKGGDKIEMAVAWGFAAALIIISCSFYKNEGIDPFFTFTGR